MSRLQPLLLCARLAVCALLALGAPLSAQDRKDSDESWREDPYTGGDPGLMKSVGYESFGPFPWGDGQSTRRVEEVLGNVRVLWVETQHFKLGSSLPEYRVAREKEERTKIREELERLSEKLPEVDPGVRKLDPWLRLHLYAQRLEDFHAEFCRRAGVTDADFPARPGERPRGRYMGEGPHLGQPAKFTVLLFEKASSFGRYSNRYIGPFLDSAKRHHFTRTGSMFFGTTTELFEGGLENDTALHCHLVFGLTHNLVDGYKFYQHDIPLWLKEGLAHWFSRNVNEEHNNFSQATELGGEMRADWNWAPRVRARVRHDYYPSTREMSAWTSYDEVEFIDHMMTWSRVDFLMSRGDAQFAEFLGAIKAPIEGAEGVPGRELILEHQDKALRGAFGMEPEALDAAWAEWVLETYPKK